jgi:6-phosphofructokinase 1
MSKLQNIALLTSGGDAPGMNACIRAVTRTAIYHKIGVFGVLDGFNGLVDDHMRQLGYDDVSNIIQRGGTILGTARSDRFLKEEFRAQAYRNLKNRSIDALIIIGGDGSFKGGQILSNEFDLPVIGIPGTIDNDIQGTDYTIGFDTALNTIIDAIDKIRDTASSHHRLFLVEVMGNNSGILALNAAAASGAEEVFMPERQEDLEEFEEKIRRALQANKSSIVVVAEGDALGGAKELKTYLERRGVDSKRLRIAILGHMQRGGSPSFRDRLDATRLGEAAIVALLKEQHNVMVGIEAGNIIRTPLNNIQTKSLPKNMDYLKLIRKLSVY